MSKIISIDIEATGKFANTARMLSLGFVTDDRGSIHAGEEYFMYDGQIPQSSIAVHGITNSILLEKSQGLYFEDKIEQLKDILWDPDAIAIGYNCNTYDFRVIDNALMELGYPPHKFKNVIDLYSVARKRWKPSKYDKNQPVNLQLDTVYNQCLKEFRGSPRFVESIFDKICSSGVKAHHTAAWDAYMTYYVCRCLCPELFKAL